MRLPGSSRPGAFIHTPQGQHHFKFTVYCTKTASYLMKHEIRYAIHPDAVKTFQTQQLREAFLVENLFPENELSVCYTHYDRLIIGGANPATTPIHLETFNALKADF